MSLFSGMSADKSADASADALCIIIHIYLSMGVKYSLQTGRRGQATFLTQEGGRASPTDRNILSQGGGWGWRGDHK